MSKKDDSEKDNSEDLTLLRDLVANLLGEGRYQEACVVARLHTRVMPEDPAGWTYLGSALLALGEGEEAEHCLKKAIDLGGDKFAHCAGMAEACLMKGDLQGAIQWCQRSMQQQTNVAKIYLTLASAYTLSGNLEEAVRVLERVAEITPSDSIVNARLGNLYMRTGALAKAVESFREALQHRPADATLWGNLGHCLSRLGSDKEALWAFKKAVQLEPNDPVFLYDLGDAHLTFEEPKKALGPLLKAIQRKPDYPLAHYDLGLAFFRLGKYVESAAASKAALQDDPEMRVAQSNLGLNATTNLGLCLMNLGQLEEALSCFERIVQIFAPTYFNIGLVQFRLHRYKEALVSFKKALEISSNDPEYLDLLGNAYSELGQLTEAQAALECAIDADPKYALAHYDLGTVLARIEGQQDRALGCFERAIGLDPDLFWAYYSVGCIHAKAGRKDLALQSIEKALDKGMKDFDHITKDLDLEGIREDSSFQDLLRRYHKE